eukprot:149161_1
MTHIKTRYEIDVEYQIQSKLLIHGYINRLKNVLNHKIPTAIINMCYEFFYIEQTHLIDGDLIYDSKNRSNCLKCLQILWCGCFGPDHQITTTKIKIITNGIKEERAMIATGDVQRQQSCCQCCLSCCCQCCVDDIADIILYGFDDTGIPQLLKDVPNSVQTFNDITQAMQKYYSLH